MIMASIFCFFNKELNCFPDVLIIGDSYDLVVGVTYESGALPVFSDDNLRIKYITDKMLENGLDAGNMGGPQDVTIQLGETVELEIWNFDILNEQFRTGGNIVVIWPSYGVEAPTDSLTLELQATESQGIAAIEKALPQMRNFWASSEISQEAFDELSIQNAWISGSDGRVICAILPNQSWNRESWPSGVYFLSIADKSGRIFTHKAFKP